MGEVSCRNITWLVDLCLERGISPQLLLKNIPYTLEHLGDPGKFVDWHSYSNFISNFRKFLSLEDIIEASRHSWEHPVSHTYSAIGRVLFNVKEQYIRMYGNSGVFNKHFPCDMTVLPLATDHLTVSLKMKEGLVPCETFHYILLGQLTGLPESLGSRAANVRYFEESGGARFEISYDEKGGFLSPLRKCLTWPFTVHKITKELSSTYDVLTLKHSESLVQSEKIENLERSLRESIESHTFLSDRMSEVVVIWDEYLNLTYISPSIISLSGYGETEILQAGWPKLFTDKARFHLLENLKRCMSRTANKRSDQLFEIEALHKSDQIIPIEISLEPISETTNGTSQIVGVIRNISARKQLELDFLEREESYRVITATAQDGILTIDQNSLITFTNPSCARIFGYESKELIGKDLTKLMPEEFRSLHKNTLKKYIKDNFRHADWNGRSLSGLTKNGEEIPIDISFSEYRLKGQRFFTAIIRDFSQRKLIEEERQELERKLLASQKMESIGQLAGGIAHDFNNLLVAILGYVDLAMEKSLDETTRLEYLEHIGKAGKRAADMTQKLLAFSRRQLLEPANIDLNELVSSIEPIISRLIPVNINIDINICDHPARILADPGQLEQVIINLAVNARDAMPKGGNLSIKTSRVSIEEKSPGILNQSVSPGEYICLDLTDSGEGMTREVSEQIFEPFYTTKPEGSGTGLGLSVVFGIIKQHDGFIEVESKRLIGTSLRAYLPMARAKAKAQPVKRPLTVSKLSGSGSILIVEDDESVRNLARLILTGAGYLVVECANGEEALRIFSTTSNHFDLVLMDVVMPKIGGKEVMQRMKSINSDTRFLFTSGYAANGIHTNFILENNLDFIGKPYTTEALKNKVNQLLTQENRKSSNTAMRHLPAGS